MTNTAHVPTPDELEDFWDSPDLLPVRTASACNKRTSTGICSCTEFVPGGRKIGRDTEASCARCLDTPQSHQPRKQGKQAKRGN